MSYASIMTYYIISNIVIEIINFHAIVITLVYIENKDMNLYIAI